MLLVVATPEDKPFQQLSDTFMHAGAVHQHHPIVMVALEQATGRTAKQPVNTHLSTNQVPLEISRLKQREGARPSPLATDVTLVGVGISSCLGAHSCARLVPFGVDAGGTQDGPAKKYRLTCVRQSL